MEQFLGFDDTSETRIVLGCSAVAFWDVMALVLEQRLNETIPWPETHPQGEPTTRFQCFQLGDVVEVQDQYLALSVHIGCERLLNPRLDFRDWYAHAARRAHHDRALETGSLDESTSDDLGGDLEHRAALRRGGRACSAGWLAEDRRHERIGQAPVLAMDVERGLRLDPRALGRIGDRAAGRNLLHEIAGLGGERLVGLVGAPLRLDLRPRLLEAAVVGGIDAGDGEKLRSISDEGHVPELVLGELSICEPGVPLLPLDPFRLKRPSSIPNADANVRLRIFFTCLRSSLEQGVPDGLLSVPGREALPMDRIRLDILENDSMLEPEPLRISVEAET